MPLAIWHLPLSEGTGRTGENRRLPKSLPKERGGIGSKPLTAGERMDLAPSSGHQKACRTAEPKLMLSLPGTEIIGPAWRKAAAQVVTTDLSSATAGIQEKIPFLPLSIMDLMPAAVKVQIGFHFQPPLEEDLIFSIVGWAARLVFPSSPGREDVAGQDIMASSGLGPTPTLVLALKAISSLSHFQPPLEEDLIFSIVGWAARLVFPSSPGREDVAGQNHAKQFLKSVVHICRAQRWRPILNLACTKGQVAGNVKDIMASSGLGPTPTLVLALKAISSPGHFQPPLEEDLIFSIVGWAARLVFPSSPGREDVAGQNHAKQFLKSVVHICRAQRWRPILNLACTKGQVAGNVKDIMASSGLGPTPTLVLALKAISSPGHFQPPLEEDLIFSIVGWAARLVFPSSPGREDVAGQNHAKQFLKSVVHICRAQRWRPILNLACTKGQVAGNVKDIMASSGLGPTPTLVLALKAISSPGHFQPPLEEDLIFSIVGWAARLVFPSSPGREDVAGQNHAKQFLKSVVHICRAQRWRPILNLACTKGQVAGNVKDIMASSGLGPTPTLVLALKAISSPGHFQPPLEEDLIFSIVGWAARLVFPSSPGREDVAGQNHAKQFLKSVVHICRAQRWRPILNLACTKGQVAGNVKDIMASSGLGPTPTLVLALKAISSPGHFQPPLEEDLIFSIVGWAARLVFPSSPGREDVAGQNHAKQFLKSVVHICRAQRWRPILNLACTKGQVAGNVKDIMASSGLGPTPTLVLALKAISSPGHFQPPLEEDLIFSIVGWAVRLVFPSSPGREDVAGQHLAYWMQREEAEVRMRAASLSCSLLRFNVPEPLFGSAVAQLAVSLMDPVPEIRQRAREAASHLYVLLLRQQGLSGKDAPFVWHLQEGQPLRAGCFNAIRIGKVFGGCLTPAQEESFLRAAWEQVMCLSQEWTRVGGLFLLFSLLGQAYSLLEEEEECMS
ncbi:UNVERIFIED_CONTAM: hypothetical protein K2H54_014278 [Gekko kuhli]